MITIILNLINKAMEGILISELKEKKIIDGSEVIPVENKNKNYNIIGSIFYLLVTLITNYSTSLLMLFIKENSDRCHYYNGKWNKKDLAIGISSIVLGSIAKYFITLI
jgi:hypothetical protein